MVLHSNSCRDDNCAGCAGSRYRPGTDLRKYSIGAYSDGRHPPPSLRDDGASLPYGRYSYAGRSFGQYKHGYDVFAVEDGEEPKGPKKLGRRGPIPKCYGGVPRRDGSLVRVTYPCRTPGTARPTAIFQCMGKTDLKKHPQAGSTCPDPTELVDSRGPDHFPPQGGMLTKTCAVKAQFMGEIVIKKDIPPRIQGCGGECKLKKPESMSPPCGGGQAAPPCGRPMSPTHHHQTPVCCAMHIPNQPEISEECRRMLRRWGPDSSRCHPEVMMGEVEERCCLLGGCDFHPDRKLAPGEEEKYESQRTREEITLEPGDPRSASMGAGCDQDGKYVRLEDTFRRCRAYNPPTEAPPPPMSYPCTGHYTTPPPECPAPTPTNVPCYYTCLYPPCQPYILRYEGCPCYSDKLCGPEWADQLYNPNNEYEPTRCTPACYQTGGTFAYTPSAEYVPPQYPNLYAYQTDGFTNVCNSPRCPVPLHSTAN